MREYAFTPVGASISIATPGASSAVQFGSDVTGLGKGVTTCMVVNDTNSLLFIKFGKGSAPTVDTTGIPVRSGETVLLDKGEADYVAARSLAGTAATGNVYFQAGIGD